MNRTLLAAVVSGALALPLAASVQADATVYGNLRFGVKMSDNDVPNTSSMWDLGANRGSRFGIKGSTEAGEGMTAGFHLERAIGFDNLKARHHNVSLSGGFGTLKFGQQDAPYYGATTWDGSQTLGGLTDFIFRASGVSYASNLGGPFNFQVMAGSGDGGKEAEGDGANHIEASGSLNTGPVNLTVGYLDDDGGQERIGGTVGGGLASFNWEIGYDSGTDACGMGCDDDRYGAHVGYAIGDGNVYVQYSEKDSDDNMDDTDGWAVGYSHVLATNVVVYAEHGRTNSMNDTDGEVATNTTVFAVKVGF